MANWHINLESNFGRQTGVHVSAYLNESDAVIKLNIICRSTGWRKHFFSRTTVISWPFATRMANTRSYTCTDHTHNGFSGHFTWFSYLFVGIKIMGKRTCTTFPV